MIWKLVALLSLGLLLCVRGTPTAYVPVPARPTPPERVETAVRFLSARGADLTGYTAHQVMVQHQTAALYLQKVLTPKGLVERMERDPLPLFYWQIHLVKEGELRQYWVRVTLDGRVGAFVTKLPETAKDESIPVDEARARAVAFVPGGKASVPGTGPTSGPGWREVERAMNVLPKRTDHRFVFARDLDVGKRAGADEDEPPAQERLSVSIQGRTAGGHRTWLKVPEAFDVEQSREDTYADAMFWLSITADVALVLGAVWALLALGGKPREERFSPPLRAALIVMTVLVCTSANYAPITVASDYAPERPLAAFMLSNFLYLALLSAIPAMATYLMLAGGEALDAASGERSRTETFRLWLAGRWGDARVRDAMATGLLYACALGGGEAIFYHLGQSFGPVTLPVEARWVNTMATPFPFLYPLSIGVGAAITEECAFRLFAIGWLRRLGVPKVLALLLPAMAWAFAHSREAVYPVWVRGSELVLGGMLLGWFFLEADLLAVITAHYMYDVVVFGWALVDSADPVARVGSWLVIAVALVPGALGLLARWRNRPTSATG
jgi:hypothetical protein